MSSGLELLNLDANSPRAHRCANNQILYCECVTSYHLQMTSFSDDEVGIVYSSSLIFVTTATKLKQIGDSLYHIVR